VNALIEPRLCRLLSEKVMPYSPTKCCLTSVFTLCRSRKSLRSATASKQGLDTTPWTT
jgi:hypothetical protein